MEGDILQQQVEGDILQQVDGDDITNILDVLKTDLPQSVTIYNFIKVHLDWKEKNPESNFKLYCPNGSWKNGTVVCIVECGWYGIAVHTLEPSCQELVNSLTHTQLIQWGKKGLFFPFVHERFYAAVKKVLMSKVEGEIVSTHNTTYWMHQDRAAELQATLLTTESSRFESRSGVLSVVFHSPSMQMQCGWYGIAVHTLEPSCQELVNSLTHTQLIQWGKKGLFFPFVHERFYAAVKKVLMSKVEGEIVSTHNTTYWMHQDRAAELQATWPGDVYVSSLDISHAAIVNASWPHQSSDSLQYVQKLIELSYSAGLFLNNGDGKPVCWALQADYGIGLLHTTDPHLRKGYARILMKYMFNMLGKRGLAVNLCVVDGNLPSHRLFHSLGCEEVCKCVFLTVNN
uniref:Glycine N-acyltransferase-like protein n=1 Tax=Timema cristinae TaxID=61476 RepID=A0A7R9CYG6_TIMCR|nr:unnamed protein product [Timema cristinae]